MNVTQPNTQTKYRRENHHHMIILSPFTFQFYFHVLKNIGNQTTLGPIEFHLREKKTSFVLFKCMFNPLSMATEWSFWPNYPLLVQIQTQSWLYAVSVFVPLRSTAIVLTWAPELPFQPPGLPETRLWNDLPFPRTKTKPRLQRKPVHWALEGTPISADSERLTGPSTSGWQLENDPRRSSRTSRERWGPN